ncbi:MAG: membrane protein [Candidatus Syntrophoarchaeum butanivorans]|uniref:Membrane protein n=1 Tax=Candidatus Syntropharchaeum butanivorans TaxID=1839936 RepID=A0A1F2P6M0_9EURY|nr:MAG: membrane protein [Candidatus Syntrophoarchaeum butanivorans]
MLGHVVDRCRLIMEAAKAEARRFMQDHCAQVDSVSTIGMVLFTIVIIGAISVYVADQVYDIASIDQSSEFYTASQKVVSVMNTGWAMMLIVVIALMAGIIIYSIRGLGGGGESV